MNDLADGADGEGTPALLAELAKISAQTNPGKRQQKSPAREIGKTCELRFGKEAEQWRAAR